MRTLEERGKWPHIRSNWVTNENGVLQVSSRTQQPWIENNAALIKIAQVTQPDTAPLLTYPWTPITLSEIQEGPALENYLVAIAESGSFGADLVLPLHERFQNDLLLGLPQARAWWTDMRRAIAFYASNLTNRYQAAATIGVVTADPMRWFEVMNLLARHTLPFDLIPQDKFVGGTRDLSKLDLLVVLDAPDARQVGILTKFAENGGIVVLPGIQGKFPWQSATPTAKTDTQTTYTVGKGRIVEHRDPPANPDTFAQQVRQLLGRDGRVLQTWNGITVIAARYEAPARRTTTPHGAAHRAELFASGAAAAGARAREVLGRALRIARNRHDAPPVSAARRLHRIRHPRSPRRRARLPDAGHCRQIGTPPPNKRPLAGLSTRSRRA